MTRRRGRSKVYLTPPVLVSAARVTRVEGERRWTERVEREGSIHQLQAAVAAEAEANGWRVVGFVPVQYGREA